MGASFALGKSSYKLMGFEKDKPKVLLRQTSEKLFQKAGFSQRQHKIVAVHHSQLEVKVLSINLNPMDFCSREGLVPNCLVFREF